MGDMIGIIFGGRVFDKIRGHPIMTVMLALMAFFTALMPLSNVLWQLALIFLLLGFAAGILHVGCTTCASAKASVRFFEHQAHGLDNLWISQVFVGL